MTFSARTWDSDAAGNRPLMSTLEAEVADLSFKLEAAKNIGICIANVRFDQGDIATGANITAKHGAPIPADLNSLSSTLQVRTTIGVRVATWGPAASFQGTGKVSYFSGTSESSFFQTAATAILTPPAGVPVSSVGASAWGNTPSELAQILDLTVVASVTSGISPTTWQLWAALWIRST